MEAKELNFSGELEQPPPAKRRTHRRKQGEASAETPRPSGLQNRGLAFDRRVGGRATGTSLIDLLGRRWTESGCSGSADTTRFNNLVGELFELTPSLCA